MSDSIKIDNVTRGELMRYLSEPSFVPDEFLHKHRVCCREDDATTLSVGAGTGKEAAEITLLLGRDGRLAGIFASDRLRLVKKPFLRRPGAGNAASNDSKWCGGFRARDR